MSGPVGPATSFQIYANFPKKIRAFRSPPASGQLPFRLLMERVFAEFSGCARSGKVLHNLSTTAGG